MSRKRKKKKSNWINNLILGIIGSIIATIIVTLSVKIYHSHNSIYGTWYAEEWEGGNLHQEITFNEDGSFLDGSIGATFGADNGKLVIYYNPLYGNSTYDYEIKNGKLYLYRHNNLYYVYIRKEPK